MTTVTVISEDGQPFTVRRSVFKQIGIYRGIVEDDSLDTSDLPPFPIHAVTGNILSKVIAYLDATVGDPSTIDTTDDNDDQDMMLMSVDDVQSPRDRAFFASLDLPTLIELTKAANYLHCPRLLEQCCRAVAGHMRGLSTEQLREKFNIDNDFTKDEEERLRKETAWCFE